jgi:hypothetical protein
VGEDAFGLKAGAKPSQGFPSLLPCGGHPLWEGNDLASGRLLPDLGLREGGVAQAASGALLGAGDGSHLGCAGSVEEGDGGRFVVPDLGSASGVADDDGRGRGFLEGETEMLAGDGFGRAVAAEVRRDLVIARGDLGADDASIGGHTPILTQSVH